MPYPAVDLTRIRTFPVQRRENLVASDQFVRPGDPLPPLDAPELAEVAARIVAAAPGRPPRDLVHRRPRRQERACAGHH